MPQSTYSVSVSGGDYVSVPLPAVGSGDDFCLSFWAMRDGGAGATFQAMFDDDTGARHWAQFVNVNGTSSFNGSIYAFGLSAWSADAWHHFAIRRVSGQLYAYLDGSETGNTVNSHSHSALNLHFGDNPSTGGTAWLGKYDDIAFWSSSIPSPTDIANIAIGTDAAGLSPTRLWRLQEGTGTVAGDSAGGAHDGAISGGTWSSDVPSALAGGGTSGGGCAWQFIRPGITRPLPWLFPY